MVPPLSVMSSWSGIRSMTGWGRVSDELTGVGVRPAQHVAGELHHRHLHAQADAEDRAPGSRGRSGWRRSCPQCPGRRSRRAPGCRRTPASSSAALSSVSSLGVHPPDIHHRRRCRCRRGSGPPPRRGRRRGAATYLPTRAMVTPCSAGGLGPLHHGAPLGQVRLVGRCRPSCLAHHLGQTLLAPACRGTS